MLKNFVKPSTAIAGPHTVEIAQEQLIRKGLTFPVYTFSTVEELQKSEAPWVEIAFIGHSSGWTKERQEKIAKGEMSVLWQRILPSGEVACAILLHTPLPDLPEGHGL